MGPSVSNTAISRRRFRALSAVALPFVGLATSPPLGPRIGAGIGVGVGHLLRPDGLPPRWHNVSISATLAAVADALATAACLLDRAAIDAALAAFSDARREHLS